MERGLGYILEELQSVNNVEESDDEIINWHDSDKILTPLEKPKTKFEETLMKGTVTPDDEEEFSLSQIECPNNSNLSCNSESVCRIIPGSVSSLDSSEIKSVESINTGTISNLQITNTDPQKVPDKVLESKKNEKGNNLLTNNSTSRKTSIPTKAKRKRELPSSKNGKAKLDNGKIRKEELNTSTALQPRVMLHDLQKRQKISDTKTVEEKDNDSFEFPSRSVKCLYSRGEIVWAKVPGYSFWPAMVDNDPDVNTHYWTRGASLIPTHYHVVFFDTKDRLSRSWVKPNNMKLFVEMVKVDNKRPSAYVDRFKASIKSAREAAKLSVRERLKIYSFNTRMKSPGIKLCQD